MAIFDTTTESKEVKAKKPSGGISTTAGFRAVLVQPRISEKSTKLQEKGKYVFTVFPNVNKIEVKKAIEQTYKVTVTQVNMVIMKGRKRNFGKTVGRTPNFKKAIVTLKAGEKLESTTESV